ncbi:hypothetical protein B566_EDAN004986 [Ephemera danica]|nr:hypothetical protein B566_EDAN004986 [Ephemera danica]
MILLAFGAIVAVFFSQWVQIFIGHEIVLRNGSQTFGWWRQPPVTPIIKIYIYNVTNADEFLIDGEKPRVQELGPYVYRQEWERMNVTFNENGTVSFQQRKTFFFDPDLSVGDEEDMVVVPNIPMLSATSQSKHAARFLRLAMASIMDILKIKPFVEVSVAQLLWGYEDPLLKLAKDVVPKEQKLPYEEFGLFYGKNGTSDAITTVFTGRDDITKYGLIDRFNGRSHLPHWTSEACNKEVITNGGVPGYRFSPPLNVFGDLEHNPDNACYCPQGPPCAPNGLFNVSACQYDSPIMLSFPHFYLADPKLREAMMGTALRARAAVQINLAVTQVVDIKQVATFPDIGIDGLPSEVTDLLSLATTAPPIAKAAISYGLFVVGGLLLLLSVFCLIRSSSRQETLTLENSQHYKPPQPRQPRHLIPPFPTPVANGDKKEHMDETLTLENSQHYKPPQPRQPRHLIPPFPTPVANGDKKEHMDVMNPGFVGDAHEAA